MATFVPTDINEFKSLPRFGVIVLLSITCDGTARSTHNIFLIMLYLSALLLKTMHMINCGSSLIAWFKAAAYAGILSSPLSILEKENGNSHRWWNSVRFRLSKSLHFWFRHIVFHSTSSIYQNPNEILGLTHFASWYNQNPILQMMRSVHRSVAKFSWPVGFVIGLNTGKWKYLVNLSFLMVKRLDIWTNTLNAFNSIALREPTLKPQEAKMLATDLQLTLRWI